MSSLPHQYKGYKCKIIGILFFVLFYIMFFTCTPNIWKNIRMSTNTKEEVDRNIVNSRLLNMTNFRFVMSNANICSQTKVQNSTTATKMMLVLVHSARKNFVSRSVIRKTWGSVKHHKNWHIQTVFLIGDDDDRAKRYDKTKLELMQEFYKNEDIVIGNFKDTYRNLPYKHVMGYKWTDRFCSQTDYILKVDDDIFVNIFHLLMLVNSEPETDIFCIPPPSLVPMRCDNCKWYVTMDEFRLQTYPPHCLGAGYVISRKWMDKIYQQSLKTNNFLWIDDVFVTGILRREVEVAENESMNVFNIRPFFSIGSSKVSPFHNYSREISNLLIIGLDRNIEFASEMNLLWHNSKMIQNRKISQLDSEGD